MKLLFCLKCQDARKLGKRKRYCACRQSSGRYIDDVMAEVSGPCEVICFANSSLAEALKNPGSMGKHFVAWVNRHG
jgi:hypothetical protein